MPKRKSSSNGSGGLDKATRVGEKGVIAPSEASIWTLIRTFCKENAGHVATYLILVILTSVLSIVLVSKVTARFQKNVSDADVTTGYRSLFVMMLILMSSFALGYITDFMENRLFPKFVAWSESRMMTLILKKNEANPELDVDANVYRQILQRTSSSAAHIFQEVLYNIIPNAMVLIVMFAFLFKLNWRFGLVFLAVAVAIGTVATMAKGVVIDKAKTQETKAKEAEWRAFDLLFNMDLVVSKNMVDVESKDMDRRFSDVCKDKITYMMAVDNIGYLVQTISYVGVFFVFFLALKLFGRRLAKGLDKKKKDAEAKKILTLISVLMGVRIRLQGLAKSQTNTIDSLGKYEHIADQVKHIVAKDVAEGTETETNDSTIAFDDVHFHYGPKHVLKGVSLHVKDFETVVIKGRSGSGKSTLAKMCLRTVEPESGTVAVGGHPVAAYTLKALKQKVSYVNPDQSILNRTIRENIMYGIVSVTPEKTKEAEALWASFSGVFSGKTLDSRAGVGGGVELSTGQKQLVRLMNILVCGNKGILILDEPTGGLDAGTKKHVLDLINNIRTSRTRTIVIITHDEDCAKVSDRTLVMTNGVLVEVPTPKPSDSK